MFIMTNRKIRDMKMKQLINGYIAYAESNELIRIMKRDIKKYNLHVHCDHTTSGCWFTPLNEQPSS